MTKHHEVLELYKQLSELKSVTTFNERKDILLKYQDDKTFTHIIKYLNVKTMVTGISSKKLNKPVIDNTTIIMDRPITSIVNLIEWLLINNTGRDMNVLAVNMYIRDVLGHVPLSEAMGIKNFIGSIVTKSLTTGTSVSTLKKVYGNEFITTFDVMKGKSYKPNSLNGQAFSISVKEDGNRALVIVDNNGNVVVKNNNGVIIEDVVDIEGEMLNMPKGFVYDGELVATPITGKEHSKELFSMTQSILKTEGIKKGLTFHMFDMIPIDEFYGKGKTTYISRLTLLLDSLEEASNHIDIMGNEFHITFDSIKVIQVFYTGHDESMIDYHLKKAVDDGKEGLMINLMHAVYENKRTGNILKVKEFATVDLKVLSVNADKYGTSCGSLTVEYKNSTVNVPIQVAELKRSFWDNPDSIVGKIIEVKYKDETCTKGLYSLRFPTFVNSRNDKTEASYN